MEYLYLLMMQYVSLGRASTLVIGVFDSEEDAVNFYKDENRLKAALMDAVDEAIKANKEDAELMRVKEIIDTGWLGLFEKLDIILHPVKKY